MCAYSWVTLLGLHCLKTETAFWERLPFYQADDWETALKVEPETKMVSVFREKAALALGRGMV